VSLKLIFLGRLEDIAGVAEREVAPAATLAQLVAALEPALSEALREPRIRVARNGELVRDHNTLKLADGDEIAFLPPVSGG
jgi:sulfur-carrier protein